MVCTDLSTVLFSRDEFQIVIMSIDKKSPSAPFGRIDICLGKMTLVDIPLLLR